MSGRVLLWAPLASVVLLAGLFAIALLSDPSERASDDPRIGAPLPALPLQEAEGLTGYDLGAIEGPYLLNVWASWCPPCRVEHPTFAVLDEAGVPIYSIIYKDETRDARRFLAELGDVFEAHMADPEGRAAIELGVTGPPETFVVDADGVVRARFRGAVTEDVWRTRLGPAWEAATAARAAQPDG